MAGARPTFPYGAAIYASANIRPVQPPDDRTYSTEVTALRRNLPLHRSARIVSPHTLDYNTTCMPVCQAQIQKKSQLLLSNFGHFADLLLYFSPLQGSVLTLPYRNRVIPLTMVSPATLYIHYANLILMQRRNRIFCTICFRAYLLLCKNYTPTHYVCRAGNSICRIPLAWCWASHLLHFRHHP